MQGARCLPRDGMNLSPASSPPLQYRLFRGMRPLPFEDRSLHAVYSYLKDRVFDDEETTEPTKRKERGGGPNFIPKSAFEPRPSCKEESLPLRIPLISMNILFPHRVFDRSVLARYKGCQWWGICGISFETRMKSNWARRGGDRGSSMFTSFAFWFFLLDSLKMEFRRRFDNNLAFRIDSLLFCY